MSSKNLKPLVRARWVRPVQDRNRRSLTRHFEELLFCSAQVLSEGDCRKGRAGERTYYGSTMITVDLAALPAGLDVDFRSVSREDLHAVLDGSVRVRLRAMRLARAEVVRRAPAGVLGTAQGETQIRLDERYVHIDVDLEVPILCADGQTGKG